MISFADEEGARFNTPTFGSKALAGKLDVTVVNRENYHVFHGFVGEMLTGRVPFRAKNFVNLAIMQVDAVPPKPSTMAEDVDLRNGVGLPSTIGPQ